MNHLIRIALAAAVACSAPAAFAAASSALAIHTVTITLTDLDPLDGIAPSITPLYASQPYLNVGAAGFDPGYSNDAYAALGGKAGSQLAGAASTPFAQSSALVSGAATIAGFDGMTLAGGAQSSAVGYGEYGALAASFTAMNFTISANTAVTVTFGATIDLATTIGMDAVTGESELAKAHLLLRMDGVGDDGIPSVDELFFEPFAAYRFDALGNPVGDAFHWAGDLSVSFSNLDNHDNLATFYGEGGLGGHSIAAVPEPATYGMLLGGLALLGAAARRRR